jgi:hypothetical protein
MGCDARYAIGVYPNFNLNPDLADGGCRHFSEGILGGWELPTPAFGYILDMKRESADFTLSNRA